jgi:excisionase family DNA binding protein
MNGLTRKGERDAALEPYVSADVVADYLKLDRRKVLALTRSGKLPAHPIDATARRKLWRFKLSEIDAAILRNTPTGGLSEVPVQINNVAGSPRSQRG